MPTIQLNENQVKTLMGLMLNESIDANDPETFIGGYFSFRFADDGKTIGIPIEDCEWSDEDHAFRFFNYSLGGSSKNVIVDPMDLERLTQKPWFTRAKLVVSSEKTDKVYNGTVKWSKGPKFSEMADK